MLSAHADSDSSLLVDEQGNEISYREFFAQAAQLANVLVLNNVSPGDRVAMQVAKSPQALALYVACVQSGAVFLPLNTAYTANEVNYFLDDAKPSLLVCDPSDAADFQNRTSLCVQTLDADGNGTLVEAAAGQPSVFETCERVDDDLAAILYTSGTTGLSKGAMLTQRNLWSNTEVLVSYWRFTASDRLLHALPIYHTHGLFVASNIVLCCGASMEFLPAFSVDTVIERLPVVTSMMGVPTFYTRLLADERFNRELCGHMRLFTSGSAPMLLETHLEFESKTGQRILERYGMTETGMSTSNPYNTERRVGTVGFPLPGVELRICDATSGQPLEQGQIGIIEVRGPNVFSGYWEKPEKTAEEFREDGFFITGDLAVIDEDGYVSIVGRNKDLIITGGFNVYPKEIEQAIDQCEGVLESAVIGLDHKDFGEAVTAVIVLNAEKSGSGSDTQEEVEQGIRDSIAESLAKFKCPKQYLFVDELPRNTMGKVQKNSLRDQYAALYQ